jgi:excisionase family DNA binding protein
VSRGLASAKERAKVLPRFHALEGNGATPYMAADYQILTPSEVCDMLRIHRDTLYRLIKEGKIQAFRIGTDWRFHRDSVLSFITDYDER